MKYSKTNYRYLYDYLGFSASFLCAIHCAVVPLLITFSALGSLAFLANPAIEWTFIGLGLFLALLSLWPSYKKYHHKKRPLLWAISGFALIALSRIEVHELWEAVLTPLGALGISMAHYINWKYLKQCRHKH
ncbi:MerC domain-containing protein [Sinomicrobium weinanense]|uniref:MerC domain-containing protein n=1 Tax=Sinomicrobium weinanense TaxID=2842200 RepID=A0A926Q528_9FLAO|nr:MerC domain-containing protein [Sinomicrobium weinanense]MBC9798639.1 MerC domain-containing protein [Sinomicrobium weinanense]MBU3122803.1 MerC domain-containing protein [Sinomicrobium weinanense]